MKGYLDINELEKYKKDDIKKIARDLGVSDTGTIKEIAARCAAVGIDVPEEAAAGQEEERAAREQAETAEAAEKAATEQKAREETEAAALITVKVVTRFFDKKLNRIKEKGETYEVSRERAAELGEEGVVEILG